jgi:hypothetical protein
VVPSGESGRGARLGDPVSSRGGGWRWVTTQTRDGLHEMREHRHRLWRRGKARGRAEDAVLAAERRMLMRSRRAAVDVPDVGVVFTLPRGLQVNEHRRCEPGCRKNVRAEDERERPVRVRHEARGHQRAEKDHCQQPAGRTV